MTFDPPLKLLFFSCALFVLCPILYPKKYIRHVNTYPEASAILLSILSCGTCTLLNLSTRLLLTSGLSCGGQGAPPLPTSQHIACLSLLSWLCLLCMCNLGLCQFSGFVCDLLLTSEVVEGSARRSIDKEYLVWQSWRVHIHINIYI